MELLPLLKEWKECLIGLTTAMLVLVSGIGFEQFNVWTVSSTSFIGSFDAEKIFIFIIIV